MNQPFCFSPQQARAKLAEALRSGDYTQGKHRLCHLRDGKPDCFCVMGVAAHLFTLLEPGHPIPVVDGKWARHYDSESSAAPKIVCDWLGLEYQYNAHAPHQWTLIAANDREETSFPDLADLLLSMSYTTPQGDC